jgi:hypothetical protein
MIKPPSAQQVPNPQRSGAHLDQVIMHLVHSISTTHRIPKIQAADKQPAKNARINFGA